MPNLPAGALTLLFTDIEGSTRLLEAVGPEEYAHALAEHRRRLREVFLRHGGVEVDTQGDAFFVVFPDAVHAAVAADEGQRALAAGTIRVRMALHTGTPLRTDEGYVGMDVHRAARICSTAHGGQVVLSAPTRAALGDDVELLDLGLHRLKDLGQPEKLYQLGQRAFPPLRSLNATNLPSQPGPLIGRESEVDELVQRVGSSRLITMTGPGGTGKTRLALQVAAELVPQFKDGVFWVALASVTRADDVVPSISSSLGAKGALEAHIGQRHMLLLLDNFEQVVAAAPALSDLLHACPRLHLLVASRILLRIDGEQEYGVPPLPPADAVELFRARSAVDAPDDLVLEICRRLDFLPLAVELAAARTRLLAPQELLARLDQRLPLLTGGRRDAPDRQRTLRSTIEWSHDLLEVPERELFARLAVFAGSFSPAAAEEVADADLDLLQSLVEQSLLRRWASGRLGMLDTIHEYALEQLEATGQADVLRRRHAEHLLALIRSAALSDEALGRSRADLVRPEIGNLRAALAWTLERGEHELGVLLVVEAEHFWVGSYPFEAVRWLELLLAPPAQLPDHIRARALKAAGGVTFIVGRFEQAARLYEQSLALYRALGDTRGCGVLLYRMATYWLTRDDTARARQVAEESRDLLQGTDFRREQAIVTGTLGGIAFREGDTDGGLALVRRSSDEAERLGFTWWQVHMTGQIADHLTLLGRLDEAEQPARVSLALAHEIDEQQMRMYGLGLLARLAAETDRFERAGTLWGALEAQEAHGPVGQWEDEREAYLALMPKDDEDFLRGLSTGRALGLTAAVAYATTEP